MENFNFSVTVNVKGDNGRADVTIQFPRHQPSLTVAETAIILASGVSLLIKSCEKTDGMTDVELMKMVIDYLNDQFVDTTSFSDAKVFEDGFRSTNDK